MKMRHLSILISLSLTACSLLPASDMAEADNTLASQSPGNNNLVASEAFQHSYKSKFNAQEQATVVTHPQGDSQHTTTNNQAALAAGKNYNITHYVQGLMQDLVSNLQYVNNTTPLAVASFVMLDGDYNEANILGNQIAESLIHEIHLFGIPVIDFKMTDYVRVTEQGDFIFTRDYMEISPNLPARYFVGGTLVKHVGGYLVNARIVGISSKAVVASAQTFIPDEVTDAILAPHEVRLSEHNSLENPANDAQDPRQVMLIK